MRPTTPRVLDGHVAKEQERDVFVRYGSIRAEGFRTLADGDNVRFDLVQGPKGFKAENVSIRSNVVG